MILEFVLLVIFLVTVTSTKRSLFKCPTSIGYLLYTKSEAVYLKFIFTIYK